jgi:hypothetical protein
VQLGRGRRVGGLPGHGFHQQRDVLDAERAELQQRPAGRHRGRPVRDDDRPVGAGEQFLELVAVEPVGVVDQHGLDAGRPVVAVERGEQHALAVPAGGDDGEPQRGGRIGGDAVEQLPGRRVHGGGVRRGNLREQCVQQ